MSPVFGKRRALGQHFLRDPGIIDQIARTAVDEARRSGCQALLEVGPGRGAITHPLIELLETQSEITRFTMVEKDRQLAYEWRQKVKDRGVSAPAHGLTMDVQEGDFVGMPESQWLTTTPMAVASNLPYSAGTAILTRLARHKRDIPVMVLMFQAEVAARLRAEIGTKAWGSLSIWIQNDWDVRKLCSAPPRAFAPPPDVHSEVVVLTRREKSRVEIPQDEVSLKKWDDLLKASFAHRRKMLRSGLPPGPYREALERSGIEPTQRAEALNWEEWARLYRAL
jgi:16S rRNA (adenine1518-N6/adenine1519-N6)-dimethyltransferase